METKYEFNHSNNLLSQYINDIENELGDVCSENLHSLIKKINGKKDYLLNNYFLSTCNFDYLGDSIVEAVNHTIKSGAHGVSNNMSLSTSGFMQLKATESKATKRSCDSAKHINNTLNWTISNTSKYLTPYAEGLMCSYFDRQNQYFVRQTKHNVWMVMHKSNMNNKNSTSKDHPKYKRVRKVEVRNNYMTCTCQLTQRWLMPCVHMFCVLKKKEYVTPSMFHLRWWKHFKQTKSKI